MLQLRCTGKVQKELKIKPAELSVITEARSTLGNWYVNLSVIDRRKTLLFMNERTLLSFVIYGIKKSNIENIHEIFLRALSQMLLLEGVEPSVIIRVNEEYSMLEYTKTNSKSILGNMNDLMNLYTHFIYSDGGLKYCDLTNIIKKINRTPQRNIGWGYSIDLAKELLQIEKAV